jgi:hypothetical protein
MAGDYISKHYSGTPSVLTKVTLKGHQNIYDKIEQKMISVKRFQKQSMTDEFKQECILLLQGLESEPSLGVISPTVEQQSISFQVITFHVGGKAPAFPHDLKPLFPSVPDVAVIALQEVVKSGVGMKIGNLLKKTSTSD